MEVATTAEEDGMDSDYVFLCGIMWCNYGWPEAAKELLRATDSADPDVNALARAMLAKGMTRLRKRMSGHGSSERGGQSCGPDYVRYARLC